jgi:ubiquitin
MLGNEPKTLEEAKKYQYGYNHLGYKKYKEGRCAMEVSEAPYYIYAHQCRRPSGHGPENLYCKQHAKRFQTDASVLGEKDR